MKLGLIAFTAMIAFFLIVTQSRAATITCYNEGKMIYKHQVNKVYWTGSYLLFHEKDTGNDIAMIADCKIASKKLKHKHA